MEEGSSQTAERRTAALLGRVVAGKFRIESFVGGGAMGAVYRARQVALDKDVAIKILHGEHTGDETYALRFQREARAASRLDHPNSVRVLDFGREPDGLLYIAMEFLDGRDLFHVIRQDWPLPVVRTADVLGQALAALAVAHDMGIVHRDLKPENIMMLTGTDDEGRPRDVVKVCDFGIAKFTEARETAAGQKLTSQGIVVGTPEYMSPEQGKGEALDARSDLYAMGVILYQMLTGRVPFEAETAVGVVLKHVTEEATAPRALNADADPRLEAICQKAMRKKRGERYQTAREMRADLRDVARGRGGTDLLAHAETQKLAVPADVASAPTAVALDSGAVAASAVSALTPAGTVTDAKAVPTGRARTFALGGGLAIAVAAAVVWRTMAPTPASTATSLPAHASIPAPVASASSNVRASPPDTAELAPLLPPPVVPTASPAVPAHTSHAVGTTIAALPPAPPALAPAPPSPPVASPPSPPLPATPAAAVPATAAPSPAVPPTSPPQSSPPPVAAAPSPTAPAPAAPPFDPSHARVDWSVVNAGGGATAGAVQRALARTAGAWTQCYRTALQAHGARVEGPGRMHLTTDDSGNVVGATIQGLDVLPPAKSCIAGAARVHIDGVDTGDAWADVALTFKAD